MMYYGDLDGQVDLIVCSVGVFENSSFFRERIFNLLSKSLGIKLDKSLNKKMVRSEEGLLSKAESKIPVVVIPTDEELFF